MKIHWFSPLVPQHSGIAECADFVLPLLAAEHELTLWTDEPQFSASYRNLGEVRIVPESLGPQDCRALCAADAIFYNLGNNYRFHAKTLRVSLRCPGITVLHDVRLQHLFAAMYERSLRDKTRFVELMGLEYGRDGARAAKAFAANLCTPLELSEHYPLTRHAVENARALVVHTKTAFELMGGASDVPVYHLPLPFPGAKRRRCVGRRGPKRLLMFGHIAPNRRLSSVLRSLAAMPRPRDFRLDVCGDVAQPEEYLDFIEAAGLRGVVHLHGYVAERRLEGFLERADLAINLRFPTMEEGSISQLRIWAHGLPSLVTRIGWYAEVPPETVLAIGAGDEEAQIQNALRLLREDPQTFERIGAAGNDYVRAQHGPARYALGISEIARAAARRPTQATALLAARRVAELMASWTGVESVERLGQGAVRAIAEMWS